MNNILCRKICCCCFSDNKNVNPVTLTRAETITVQPTTSGGLQMSQLSSKEVKVTSKRRNGSNVSEFDEIDLNVPTDEDLQPAPVPSNVSQTFAAAVTDMMLDEIHEEASEKEGDVEEEPGRIDTDAVVEATDEEVRNTLTRPLTVKTSAKVEEENVLKKEPSLELSPKSDLTDSEVHENVLEKSDDGLTHQIQESIDVSSITPKVCEIDDETTEQRKVLPSNETPVISESEAKQSQSSGKDDSLTNETELEEMPSSKNEVQDAPIEEKVESDLEAKPLPNVHSVEEDADDETTASTDFEMKHSAAHPEGSRDSPPPLPNDPPPESPEPEMRRPTMYGALSESDSSESESESLTSPRKKPNRVSVKQTNVVITKVTAVDAPNVEEVSDLESLATDRENQPKPKGYIVLTDDEFNNVFPFLYGLADEEKKSFLEIIWSTNLTFHEKSKYADEWARKHDAAVQEAYNEWKNQTEEFFKNVIKVHQEKAKNLSIQAQTADKTFIDILVDENITPKEKCEKIVNLAKSLPDSVRQEARITPPKNVNCSDQNLIRKPSTFHDMAAQL
uniref:SXP/RAL-2 family protein Ani s 5-like cation-binding domain-containing protein n=1 Tax=Panagrolaimus sp. JU765 TaxID=591449 RepID=A0AC34RIS4_9BILA